MKKIFLVRAYCSKCKKLLMESPTFTRKELTLRWDAAVLGATGIICKDCKSKNPNFDIDLKIVNVATKREMSPKNFLPKSKFDLEKDFVLKARMQVAQKLHEDKNK